MARQSKKRDEKWEKFEEEILAELRKARQDGQVVDSFDELEEMVDEIGKVLQGKLLKTMAEQREAEGGQRCQECGGSMQRRGKAGRQLKSSQGEVRLERERWVCPTCGANVFPPG